MQVTSNEERIGSMTWSVAQYPKDGQQCWLLKTEGQVKQTIMLNNGHNQVNMVNKAVRSYWIAKNGHLLEEDSLTTLARGSWIVQATFKKDSYDLYLKNPDDGIKQTTVYPAEGIKMFDAAFTPMISGKDILLEKKDFMVVNGLNGNPVKFTATVGGTWGGKLYDDVDHSYQGHYVDIEGAGGSRQRVMITDQGDLMKVEFPGSVFLLTENRPGDKLFGGG